MTYDDVMQKINDEERRFVLVAKILGGIVIAVLVGAIALVMQMEHERARIMADCIADGHREYECVAILRGRR